MPMNHVGQYITHSGWCFASNNWLIQHGFGVHEHTVLANNHVTPTVWTGPNPGSQHTLSAWAPGYGPNPGSGLPHLAQAQPHHMDIDEIPSPISIPIPPIPYWDPNDISTFGTTVKTKNKNKIYNIPLKEVKRFKSIKKGEIGLEIECEGTNLTSAMVDYWLVHQDNSLRAVKDHPPQEYVLREPIDRDEVPKALKYLSRKLKDSGADVVYSHRTSVHVHLNCQHLTIREIYQIWCLYTVFEELLVQFSGEDRPGNLFCLSSKQAEYQVFTLQNALLSEDFNEVFNDNLRYTSCNVASLGKFGSLEFRSLRGTIDTNLIQTWIDILCILKDKALEYKNPQEIVNEFQSLNSEAFLKKTFSTRKDIVDILTGYSDRHKKMWDGLRMMRDVAYAIETWEEPLKEEKKSPPVNDLFTSTSDSEASLSEVSDDMTLIVPGVYKKYAQLDEEEDIREWINGGYQFHTGDYWCVNYSNGNRQIPNLTGTGVYTVYTNRKALFTHNNYYNGMKPVTPEDIQSGQQFEF